MDKPLTRKYYPVPPIHEMVYEYQNLNKDMNLRNTVTFFFLEKISKWILKYPEFKILSSKNINYNIIYKILRKIVKKTNLNWYELRSNSSKIKKFFLKYI
jgi:hypothetical protein